MIMQSIQQVSHLAHIVDKHRIKLIGSFRMDISQCLTAFNPLLRILLRQYSIPLFRLTMLIIQPGFYCIQNNLLGKMTKFIIP